MILTLRHHTMDFGVMSKRSKYRHDYLTRRDGCNWAVRLVYPGACRFDDCERTERHAHEISLRTSDYGEAEVKAGPYITEHKAAMLALRPRLETTWQHKLEPGREHTAPDGGRILATDRELFHIGHNGAITRTEPNGEPAFQVVGGSLTVRSLAEAFTGERPAAPKKGGDDAIIAAYLDHGGRNNRGIHGYSRREAETTWALFRRLTDNKPLKDCTRADGRLLVKHFQEEKAEPPTIQKKIGWLVSAVNHAIKEGQGNLTLNPFSGIAPKRTVEEKQEARRQPLDDADIKLCKRNLGELSEPDQLLFRLLACTGMRLAEPFQIRGEKQERGIRYVVVGTKTEQSWRRVPLPAGSLPYLPTKITGPLFAGTERAASKRLNRFLRDIGITDPHKVAYSLRHRAKDRLRSFDIQDKLAEAIFGRDDTSVGDDYGKGYPVRALKKWIDKIGF